VWVQCHSGSAWGLTRTGAVFLCGQDSYSWLWFMSGLFAVRNGDNVKMEVDF